MPAGPSPDQPRSEGSQVLKKGAWEGEGEEPHALSAVVLWQLRRGGMAGKALLQPQQPGGTLEEPLRPGRSAPEPLPGSVNTSEP